MKRFILNAFRILTWSAFLVTATFWLATSSMDSFKKAVQMKVAEAGYTISESKWTLAINDHVGIGRTGVVYKITDITTYKTFMVAVSAQDAGISIIQVQ